MRRILFFHQGSFSQANTRLLRQMQGYFAPAEVRCVNVNHLVKKSPLLLLANAGAACFDYGWDLLARRRDLDDAFFGTRFLFSAIRRRALAVHREWPADFSFQTQSMFDCSAPGTPHFVYTDHTYASCREYPAYGTAIWAPSRPAWLLELEGGLFRNAAALYTMGSNVRETALRTYALSPEKVECVGAGCNIGDDAAEVPATDERFRRQNILFIGLDWERKGGPELLEAFRRVRRVHPGATLTIVGCRPGVREPGVEAVGPLPLEELGARYASALLFCMPSRTEPFGFVWLEAMAAGLPVIGLRLGSAPDFIRDGETGRLVPDGDVEALARAMSELLADPETCMRLGAAGRRLVLERYTWDVVCRRMFDHMTRCMSETSRAASDVQLEITS